MRTAEEMIEFSKKYTTTNAIHKNAFNRLIDELHKNEIVNFAFTAESGVGLYNVAVAISNCRIIVCGNTKNDNTHLFDIKIIKHSSIKHIYYRLFGSTIAGLILNNKTTFRFTFKKWTARNKIIKLCEDLHGIFNVEITEYSEENFNKHKIGLELEPYHIGLLIIVVSCIAFIIFIISGLSNSTSVWDKEYDTCIICGGEMQCGMCGASGVYCENAQYGAGNAHYCSEHWADCCEWHEEQKNKR